MSVMGPNRKSRFIVQVIAQRLSEPHQHDFAALLRDPSEGRLVIAYEDALAEIELANSFSAANAGPPTSPPEARQMPGTM
jgi:hypothetical protein